MYFHSPNSILSAKEATEIFLQEYEEQLALPAHEGPKTTVPSRRVDFTPRSFTLLETRPEFHDQKIYQTWSQYLLQFVAQKKSPKNILIVSSYRKSQQIIHYAISHMAGIDSSSSRRNWPTKGALIKLKHVTDDTMKLPLFFTDIDKISSASLVKLSKAINATDPGLVIIEQNSPYSPHAAPFTISAQEKLEKLAADHSLAIAVLSKQDRYSPLSRA